jgi:hypothetical protein
MCQLQHMLQHMSQHQSCHGTHQPIVGMPIAPNSTHTCGVSLRLLPWLNIAKSRDKPQIASSFFTGAARQTCMYALHAHALHRACFAFTAPSSYQPFVQHSTTMNLGCQQQLIPSTCHVCNNQPHTHTTQPT